MIEKERDDKNTATGMLVLVAIWIVLAIFLAIWGSLTAGALLLAFGCFLLAIGRMFLPVHWTIWARGKVFDVTVLLLAVLALLVLSYRL